MADSNRLLILKALQTKLRLINGVGGYNYSVVSESVTLDPTLLLITANAVDTPWMMLEPTPEGTKTYHPGGHLVEIFRVNIHARHDADTADATSKATVWENLAADIERALTQDVTLGGLVYDTRLLVPLSFVGVGSNVVVLVQPVECRVHRTYGAP